MRRAFPRVVFDGQGQSRCPLAIRGCGVAELVLEARQSEVSHERRSLLGFCGAGKIIIEHLGGQRGVAMGLAQNGCPVKESKT